ncbi:hypothetical protein T492DRAFT_848772 [Pavlovales sp. CCMP2436]|nr:hypothetical protein T492DRAFT_848772 [Pavlovales sp. CCMP2436]
MDEFRVAWCSWLERLGCFPAKFTTLGTGNSRAREQLRRLDVLEEGAVEALLTEFAPEVVISAVVERDPDAAARDPERTRQLNVRVPVLFAELCAASGMVFVHVSTTCTSPPPPTPSPPLSQDYVFDGGAASSNLPPYDVDAPMHPLNFYGETKRDAEVAVLAVQGARLLILRVPVLFAADSEALKESASLVVAKALLSREPVLVDNWGSRFPTLVDDCAVVLRGLIALRIRMPADAPATILHCSSPMRITKYQLVALMATILGVDSSLVHAEDQPPKGEPRPRDTQLDCARTWLALGHGHAFTPLEEGMARALVRFSAQFKAAAKPPRAVPSFLTAEAMRIEL